MSRQSRNWVVLLSISLVLASGAAWMLLHTRIQLLFWDWIASSDLDDRERTALSRCQSPGWWTWVKVIQHDEVLPCGEAWGARALADRVIGPDRAAWLHARAMDPTLPVSVRVRAAMTLTVDRRDTPVEPAWLWMELPPDAFANWVRAAGESDEIATHLGPAGLGLARAVGLKHGRISVGEALPAMHWLASVGDPRADAWVVSAARASLSAPPELESAARSGRVLAGAPTAWRPSLSAFDAGCDAPCARGWVAVLESDATSAELRTGEAPPIEPSEFDRLATLEEGSATPATERRGLAFASRALSIWAQAGRRPAARLGTFFARPVGAAPSSRLYWDGVGRPFQAAEVSQVVASDLAIPVEVRVSGDGQVWVGFGPEHGASWATRACGVGGGLPPKPAWPSESVLAAAYGERATAALADGQTARAARLAARVAQLDSVIAEGLRSKITSPPTPVHVLGQRVGAALTTIAADSQLARDSRQRVGADLGPCDPR